MKNKLSLALIIIICLCAFLVGCNSGTQTPTNSNSSASSGETNKTNVKTDNKFYTVTADEDGNIIISTDTITENASFYNYDADGINMQLVAIRDSEGNAHISFNTCQGCSPSPKAYFTQSGKSLKCANCGFTFEPESVGLVHGGCNPWPIDGVEIGEDYIKMPASSVEMIRSRFRRWQGPTK